MQTKVLSLALHNTVRSKTRLFATVGCCLIAASIVGFFGAASSSLNAMLTTAGESANLVMTQKDRY